MGIVDVEYHQGRKADERYRHWRYTAVGVAVPGLGGGWIFLKDK
jgi:hypothetical protein